MDKKSETSSRQNNQHETITCPKCGNLNDSSSKECLKCGIVFSKYREFKERTQEQLVETDKLRKERKEKKKNRFLFIPSFLKKKLIIERSLLAWFGAGVVFVALGFIIFLILRGPENTNRPNYLKNLAVYKEGQDGLAVYFILADNFGQPTAHDGWVWLQITREDDPAYPVFMVRKRVKCSDFSSTTIGIGPYKRKTILYPFGRIPYRFFLEQKSDNVFRSLIGFRGKVELWYVYGKLPYNLEEEPLVKTGANIYSYDTLEFFEDKSKILTSTSDYFYVEEEFTF